jgi:hypothetical protein
MVVMKIVRFSYHSKAHLGLYGYACNTPDDNSGEYVSLAEHKTLFKLLERVDAIGQDIGYINRFGTAVQSPDLTQLLSDIKEVLK